MQGQGGGGAGWHKAGSGAGLPGTPGGSPLGGDPRPAPTAISTPEAPAAAARGLRVLWGPLTGPRAPSPGSATDCGHRDACGRERRGPRGGAPGGGDGSWRGGCDRRPRASHSPCDEETRPRRGERDPVRVALRGRPPASQDPPVTRPGSRSACGRPQLDARLRLFIAFPTCLFPASAVVSGPESYKLCLFAVVAQRLQYSHVTNSRINKQPFSFLTFTKTLEHFVPTRLRLDVNAVVSPATARAPSCLYPLGTRLC